jgi:Na+-translocating ferredoxin:NAD+ oxidoreductase RnfA subunit
MGCCALKMLGACKVMVGLSTAAAAATGVACAGVAVMGVARMGARAGRRVFLEAFTPKYASFTKFLKQCMHYLV